MRSMPWTCGVTESPVRRARLATSANLKTMWRTSWRLSSPMAQGHWLDCRPVGALPYALLPVPRQKLFDQYVLLAPFIHQDVPTYRPEADGWVATGGTRIIALTLLNRFGITRFNTLPVVAFALMAGAQQFLTPTYSYALATNFRPHDDYRADIGAAKQPLRVLVGTDDGTLRCRSVLSRVRGGWKAGSSHAPARSWACRYLAQARGNPSYYGDNQVIS